MGKWKSRTRTDSDTDADSDSDADTNSYSLEMVVTLMCLWTMSGWTKHAKGEPRIKTVRSRSCSRNADVHGQGPSNP